MGDGNEYGHMASLAGAESRHPGLLRAGGSAGEAGWRRVGLAVLVLLAVPVLLFLAFAGTARVASGRPARLSDAYASPVWDGFDAGPGRTASSSVTYMQFRAYRFETRAGGPGPEGTDGQAFARRLARLFPDAVLYARTYGGPGDEVLVLAVVPASGVPSFYSSRPR